MTRIAAAPQDLVGTLTRQWIHAVLPAFIIAVQQHGVESGRSTRTANGQDHERKRQRQDDSNPSTARSRRSYSESGYTNSTPQQSPPPPYSGFSYTSSYTPSDPSINSNEEVWRHISKARDAADRNFDATEFLSHALQSELTGTQLRLKSEDARVISGLGCALIDYEARRGLDLKRAADLSVTFNEPLRSLHNHAATSPKLLPSGRWVCDRNEDFESPNKRDTITALTIVVYWDAETVRGQLPPTVPSDICYHLSVCVHCKRHRGLVIEIEDGEATMICGTYDLYLHAASCCINGLYADAIRSGNGFNPRSSVLPTKLKKYRKNIILLLEDGVDVPEAVKDLNLKILRVKGYDGGKKYTFFHVKKRKTVQHGDPLRVVPGKIAKTNANIDMVYNMVAFSKPLASPQHVASAVSATTPIPADRTAQTSPTTPRMPSDTFASSHPAPAIPTNSVPASGTAQATNTTQAASSPAGNSRHTKATPLLGGLGISSTADDGDAGFAHAEPEMTAGAEDSRPPEAEPIHNADSAFEEQEEDDDDEDGGVQLLM
ncbi:uncharacterized protein LTR77_007703 [Saxophila tyrrhenica]|uniref:Uncharacterized protein n=1 Tax=Saxophila tyrrhenica TaxID=1690608 RepID=A0AAV9P4T0_9PEZI|nr:hypothetical protein LTR77_007703 [Saxophila tyrrhenica]